MRTRASAITAQMYCGGIVLPGNSVWVEIPVNRSAAMTAPPIQAGQPDTRRVMMAQYQGQKPFGPRSAVAAKNDRPVFMLYLMHSYTSAASSTTEMTITQSM